MTDSNKTEIAVILDRSGSMASIKADMEGGFAHFVAQQQALAGECVLSLYQFDDQYDVVFEDLPLRNVPPLSIVPRGSTALLDAMGRSIARIGARLAAKPDSARPGCVIIMVITDGQENASCEVTREALKQSIEHQRNNYNWQFMYLGADVSAFAEAESIGIAAAARYSPDARGVQQLYAATAASVSECRRRVTCGEPAALAIDPDLKS
jgi:hypothetical protein